MDKMWVVWRLEDGKPVMQIYVAYSAEEGIRLLKEARRWFQKWEHKLVAYQKIEEVL
jgi:hypothetical protein